MYIIPVTFRSSWPLSAVSCSGLLVALVLGHESVLWSPCLPSSTESTPFVLSKSPFLAVHTSFHYFWQWQNKESNQSGFIWRWLGGGGMSWFLKLCPLRLVLPLVTWASFTSAVMEGENPYLLCLENPQPFYPCSQVTDIYLVWNLLFCRHSRGVCSEKLMFWGFGFVFLKLFSRQLWCKPQCTTMGIRGYYFKSQFCHLLAVWHWPDLLFSEFPFPHLKNKNFFF